jgi:hypothetical protein
VLLTVVVSDDPWKSELSVGIDGNKGVLHYAGEDTPPNGVYSKSPTPTNAEPVVYYYVTADTEFPPNAEIPVSMVETSLIEYLTTSGERPHVRWLADSRLTHRSRALLRLPSDFMRVRD